MHHKHKHTHAHAPKANIMTFFNLNSVMMLLLFQSHLKHSNVYMPGMQPFTAQLFWMCLYVVFVVIYIYIFVWVATATKRLKHKRAFKHTRSIREYFHYDFMSFRGACSLKTKTLQLIVHLYAFINIVGEWKCWTCNKHAFICIANNIMRKLHALHYF